MKKIYLLTLVFLFFSCSDDDLQTKLDEKYFELSVSEITENTAKFSWKISEEFSSTGINEYELKYDLYLNDSLTLKNTNEYEYLLENLNSSELYTGKLIAKTGSNNEIEITTNFETLNAYQNYFPLQIGNVWYYSKILNHPLDYRTYRVKKEIITSEIINNKEEFLVRETEFYYKKERYYEGHEDYYIIYPCSTIINEYYLRFEDGKLIKTIDSSEELMFDFTEQSNSEPWYDSLEIIEECNENFYSINACTYEKNRFVLGSIMFQKVMKQVGIIEEKYLDENYFGFKINLVGYKPNNSSLIGENLDFECY